MATGRTHAKHTRVYIDGFDMSGYERSVGPLSVAYDFAPDAALSEAVKGGLCGHATISLGTVNGLFDTQILSYDLTTAGVARTVMVPMGIRADPAAGDPAFCGVFEQKSFLSTQAIEGMVTASMEFEAGNVTSAPKPYGKAWGLTLTPAVSYGTGTEWAGVSVDFGATGTAGGYFAVQIFSVNGTAELWVDESDDGLTNFTEVVGTNTDTVSTTPTTGIYALSTTATTKRYLRWHLLYNDPQHNASAIRFACAFVRG